MTATALTPGSTHEFEIPNAQGEAAKQTVGDTAKAAPSTAAVPTCPPLCAPIKPDQIEWGPNSRIGNAYLTPLGWVDATAISRDTDPGSNGGTNLGSIPYRNPANVSGNLSEFRFSRQNSRIGARFDFIYRGINGLGYWESDFLGTVPPNAVVSANSYSFRLRLIFADFKKNGFELLGGQSSSLITPGRRAISPLPGNMFYGQVIDWELPGWPAVGSGTWF